MRNPEEVQSQTELEPKVGDQFFVRKNVVITSVSGKSVFEAGRSSKIKINKIMPDGSLEIWLNGSYCFPISQKDFKALPLGRERRTGPVSAENPIGYERAAGLYSGDRMREGSAPEEDIRDLMRNAVDKLVENDFFKTV